jgi:NADH:ubiquinone oxidoreductase subunit 6 (subunit J)
MGLEVPVMLSIILLALSQSKISHLILSIQALVICVVTTGFLYTNNKYLSYALIYVYVGAICVLFLYFMMLLHGKWELQGTNSLWAFYISVIIEMAFYFVDTFCHL